MTHDTWHMVLEDILSLFQLSWSNGLKVMKLWILGGNASVSDLINYKGTTAPATPGLLKRCSWGCFTNTFVTHLFFKIQQKNYEGEFSHFWDFGILGPCWHFSGFFKFFKDFWICLELSSTYLLLILTKVTTENQKWP